MWKFLKKHFIPHDGNDHAPHFLRAKTVAVIIGVILLLEGAFLLENFVIIPGTNLFALIFPEVIAAKTNDNRTVESLKPLAVNGVLEEAARLKAEDMAAK